MPHPLQILLTGLMFSGFVSCQNVPGQTLPQTQNATTGATSRVNFDEYIGNFVDFTQTQDKTSRSALTDELGTPVSTEEESIENLHNPSQSDIIETLTYKDLDITLYKIAGNNEEVIIAQMLFSGPEYGLKGDIKVGDAFSAVTQYLGSPQESLQDPESDNTIAMYCDSFTGQSCLNFYHNNAVIQKIIYQSYLD